MTAQDPTLIRMRDVTMLLRGASKYDVALTRIQLQKFSYLLDAISVIYELMPPTIMHKTYQRGPYDKSVQNAVDVLAFRGIVSIRKIQRSSADQASVSYGLTNDGAIWSTALAELFPSRSEAIGVLAKQLQKVGWNSLLELAYAEPTFAMRRHKGWGADLNPEDVTDASSAFLLSLLSSVVTRHSNGRTMNPSLLVEIYFDYLIQYAQGSRSS